jgi:flagellar assembly factor FliW
MVDQDTAPSRHMLTSAAFGTVEVSASAIMEFTAPLWGFEDKTSYALLPAARDGLFWLQSTDDEVTTFILADPFAIDAAYGFELSDAEKSALGVQTPEEVLTLVMVTLPTGQSTDVTANFRGPLVFNVRTGRAMQLVTTNEAHDIRRPIDLATFPRREDGVKLL